MRTLYKIIGFSLGACIPAAFVYGFWLLHHGLGFIVGALIVACYAHYYSSEQRAKRNTPAVDISIHGASGLEQRVRQMASENLRRRGVN